MKMIPVPKTILGKFTYEVVAKYVLRSNHVSDAVDMMKANLMSEQDAIAVSREEAWTFFKEMREMCEKYEFITHPNKSENIVLEPPPEEN